MTSLWNVEWPNVNTQRRYPLMEGQSLADGTFTLPNDFLVDMVLCVNIDAVPAIDATLFHLMQVGIFSAGVTVSLGYNGEVFATINVPLTTFTEYSTYDIVGTGSFFDARGQLTIGKLETLLLSPGAWNFTATTARFVPSIIRPNLRAVTSFKIANGTDLSSPIVGDVILTAGRNFRLRVETVGTTTQIYFDAIDGFGTIDANNCTDEDTLAPPIRRINGVAPNSSGDFTLLGSSCIQINGGATSLTLVDICSAPCCDCRELEVITPTLNTMMGQIQTLETAASSLNMALGNLSANVLASRFST